MDDIPDLEEFAEGFQSSKRRGRIFELPPAVAKQVVYLDSSKSATSQWLKKKYDFKVSPDTINNWRRRYRDDSEFEAFINE